MPRNYWRGECYIYNYRTKEFMRYVSTAGKARRPDHPGTLYCRWTPGTAMAHPYMSRDYARRTAQRINREVYRHDGAKYPCAPVDVVTGEAARCLEQINQRARP